jgi:uncharacterized protein (DUF2141 family)
MIKKILFIMILLLLLLPSMNLNAQNIEVLITGIRAEKGQIAIGVFKDDETFQKEEAFLNLKFVKNVISNGEMRVQFSLEPGIYGLSLLDDVNSNGKMEYSFLGVPKEGFGFSDYYHKGFIKPKFDSFKFSIEKDQKKRITIRIRYM